MIDKTRWKIRNRLEELQNREKIVINTKILKTNQDSNVVKSEIKKVYKYYRCDYCNDEIRLDIKQEERTGGVIIFPHSLTKRGKLTLVLCNKCLKKALKEFED